MDSKTRIAVIGAGISGLVAALRLQDSADVTLFEASHHVGGIIRSERRDGFLMEHGPDCFVTNKPAGIALCRELGLEGELIGTNESHRRSFILYRGRLEPLPQGFFLIAPTSMAALRKATVLSEKGKARIAREVNVPVRKSARDESLASFVKRRLGKEALDRIAQPIVAGIYTADPRKLSLRATFPQFLDMEQKHGSILRALEQNAGREESAAAGPRYGIFASFKGGMQTLTDAVAKRLGGIETRLNTPVRSIVQVDGSWRVESGVGSRESGIFDAVIVALPTHEAAKLLQAVSKPLAKELAAIPYAGAAIVNFAFERGQIDHALDGMGFVVPAIEKRPLIGCTFSSVKFAGRAPEGKVLLRVFMGGALQPQIAKWPDGRLARTALEQLRRILGVRGKPLFSVVSRHDASMAQYHVGHVDRVRRIEKLAAKLPGLALAGNGFTGVGIPDCIRIAEAATRR